MNRVFATASIGMRVGSQTVIFFILGAALGPTALGKFSLLLAYATIIAMIAEYGTVNPGLREMSRDPAGAADKLQEYLWFRGILSAGCYAVGILTLLLCGALQLVDVGLFTALCLATFFGQQSEFMLLYFRARSHYRLEATIAVATSSLFLAVVAITVFIAPIVASAVISYLIARLLGLAIIVHGIGSARGRVRLSRLSFLKAMSRLKTNLNRQKWYAADSIITASFTQIDAVLVGHLLGLHALGLYQVAAKVLQASLSMVQLAVSIYLPILSREPSRTGLAAALQRLFLEMTGLGLLAAIGCYLLMPWIVRKVLGEQFSESDQLWLGVSIAIAARCVASGFGIFLVAVDRPLYRILVQLIIMVTLVLGAMLLLPVYGLFGMGMALATSLTIGAVLYALAARRALKMLPASLDGGL